MSVVAPHASRAGLSAFTVRTRCACPGTVPGQERSDVGGHISTEPRINDRIRVPEVRLVGPSGEQVGIVSITDALRLAQEADLDLVEVAPTARPPVCKLMDFGKFKYESALKARESRKNQAQTVIKEIKIRPKIDPHDYGTKKGHVERFLRQGDKVKVTIMFRGREQSRPELGYKLLQRLAGDVEELGFVESQPKQDGRNMIMVIGPHRKKAEAKAVRGPDRASARAAAPAPASGAEGDRVAAAAAAPRTAAASRPATASPATATPPADQAPEAAQPTFIRRAETGATGPASSRPAQSPAAGTARPAPTSQAAPRPSPPRPGPATASGTAARPGAASAGSAAARPGPAPAGGSAARPGPAPSGETARPAAPKPGPSASGTARPAAPKPGPSASGTARPAAPKPGPSASGGARPAAPKPSAPRSPAAKPGESGAVPSPRARPAAPGTAEAEAGG